MAKGAYFGVGSTAKKIKKMYIGIGGIARKVKRAYIGIAGKARLWFSGEPSIIRDPSVTLSVFRPLVSGGSVGNYAVFAGGNDDNNASADTFSASLTRRVLSYRDTFSISGMNIGGTTTSNPKFVLFPGGRKGKVTTNVVTGYNDTLSAVSASNLPYNASNLGTGNLFGNGFCAGGLTSPYSTSGKQKGVFMYNTSLTKTDLSSLDYSKWDMVGVSVGINSSNGHILFGGGTSNNDTSTWQDNYDVYNASGTKKSPINLQSRWGAGFASSDKYAVVAFGSSKGAIDTNQRKDAVFCDQSLTKHLVQSNKPRSLISGGYLNGLYFFAGGSVNEQSFGSSEIVVFNEEMTELIFPPDFDLITGVNSPMSAVAGNKLLFAGGDRSYQSYTKNITAIEV